MYMGLWRLLLWGRARLRKDTFPEDDFEFVNAGIGGTDSYLGVHRVNKGVLEYEPDLVLVEFSVNDEDSLLDEIGAVSQQHITLFEVAAVTGYLHDSASRMGV